MPDSFVAGIGGAARKAGKCMAVQKSYQAIRKAKTVLCAKRSTDSAAFDFRKERESHEKK
jgi:hypothetical protein